jgi:hypothetical protein
MIHGKRIHRTRQIQYREMRMLKSVSILLAVGGLLAAGKAEGRGCSVASLKGDYGFALLGTRPSGPPPAAIEQMIGVVLAHFDGLGHSTGTDNIHGSISGLSPDRPVSGTYSVSEDCTGTMRLAAAGAPPLELRFVLVDNGTEIRAAVMSPATVMVTANGRKL